LLLPAIKDASEMRRIWGAFCKAGQGPCGKIEAARESQASFPNRTFRRAICLERVEKFDAEKVIRIGLVPRWNQSWDLTVDWKCVRQSAKLPKFCHG
jgi:hypothetical protein